jgi:hypothetical protein
MNVTRVVALAIVALVGPGLGFAWVVSARSAAEVESRRTQARRVEAAQELLDTQLEEAAWFARRLAVVVAADSRFKVGLSTDPIDPLTLTDSLKELQEDATLDWIGVASPAGQLLAQDARPPELATHVPQLLGTLRVFTEAREGRAGTQAWFVANRALVVAAAPVLRGGAVLGVVLVGRVVPSGVFERAAELVGGGSVGLKGPGGEWVGVGNALGESDGLGRASRTWDNVVIVAPRLESSAPPSLWAPLVIIGLVAMSLLLWLVTFRGAHAK